MHRILGILAAALLATGAVAAHASVDLHHDTCGLHSDYSLSVKPDRLVFASTTRQPADVVIANGELSVDGKSVTVGAADRERLIALERGVRAAMPEVKAIARDAIAIAFGAVGEVSAAFAPDADAARSGALRLAHSASELDARIAASDGFSDWKDADIDRLLEGIVGTLVGDIVGNVAGQAIKVALTGDEKAAAELQARADGIEKNVDRAVERRSRDLKARADVLCPKLKALARLESDLDVRLAGGAKLDLVRVDP